MVEENSAEQERGRLNWPAEGMGTYLEAGTPEVDVRQKHTFIESEKNLPAFHSLTSTKTLRRRV